MTAWGHLEWALSLPAAEEPDAMPAILSEALQRAESCTDSQLQAHRASRLQHWAERKRVTGPAWQQAFSQLPAHCKCVLGPEKNLFLLAEMLESVEWPDTSLIDV